MPVTLMGFCPSELFPPRPDRSELARRLPLHYLAQGL